MQTDLLRHFLDQAGAREHLEAIKQAWANIGQVDDEPEDSVGTSGLELSLSWRHKFMARVIRSRTTYSGPEADYAHTTYSTETEENKSQLLICTHFDRRNRDAINIYGEYRPITVGGEGFANTDNIFTPFPERRRTSSILVFPTLDRRDARVKLGDTLLELLKKIEDTKSSPLHLLKYGAQPNPVPSQPWYRRILG